MSDEALTHVSVNGLVHTLVNINILPGATIPAVFYLLNQRGNSTSFREIISILDLILISFWEQITWYLRDVLHEPILIRLDCTEVGLEHPKWQGVREGKAQALMQWIDTEESIRQ